MRAIVCVVPFLHSDNESLDSHHQDKDQTMFWLSFGDIKVNKILDLELTTKSTKSGLFST